MHSYHMYTSTDVILKMTRFHCKRTLHKKKKNSGVTPNLKWTQTFKQISLRNMRECQKEFRADKRRRHITWQLVHAAK